MIELERQDGLRISVRDDGKGMPAAAEEPGGMGMRIMRFRANVLGGRLDVASSADRGTRLTVRCNAER